MNVLQQIKEKILRYNGIPPYHLDQRRGDWYFALEIKAEHPRYLIDQAVRELKQDHPTIKV